MKKTHVETYVEDQGNMRLFLQERAIYRITELIESAMSDHGVTRARLAELLGRSKGWVTQLLDGEANKTVRTIADVLAVLGLELQPEAKPIRISNETGAAFTVRTPLLEPVPEALAAIRMPMPESIQERLQGHAAHWPTSDSSELKLRMG